MVGEGVVGLLFFVWQIWRSERVCERVVGLLGPSVFPLGAKSCRAAWHERTFLSANLVMLTQPPASL